MCYGDVLLVAALHLALIAIFGIFLPFRKGLEFLDPVMTSAYARLGALFAAPAAARSFARRRPQSMREAAWLAAKAVGYGEGLALVILGAGVATVSVSRGRLLLPELDVLTEAALLGLAGSLALTLLAAWMTLRFSAGAARMGLRALFLVLLLLFVFHAPRLHAFLLRGVELSVALSALMVILVRRQVCP